MKNRFMEYYHAEPGTKLVLQGNIAFALGCARGGFHAADGYPGTPSTEAIDKGLSLAQEVMTVNWSINEVTAVAAGVGHAMAGHDSLITMKIPGLFQAADAVSTSAFYNLEMGAVVYYLASDFTPSSTQHVVDPRPFLRSCCLPILEPRNHQEMHSAGPLAADLSRKFKTPVVVLASQNLCHSEGLVSLDPRRTVEPAAIPEDWTLFVSLPVNARKNYDKVRPKRMKSINEWILTENMFRETEGQDNLGIITYGINDIIVKEAVRALNIKPGILSLAMTNPLPLEQIKAFAAKYDNKVTVFEDGFRYIQEQILQLGIEAVGKSIDDICTEWNPDLIQRVLGGSEQKNKKELPQSLIRPPMICPGCPYRAFGDIMRKMKRKGQIFRGFGDIGCSTLLLFMDALHTCLCMGASESVRAGFVQARPEMAAKTVSIIGDSCECHSGMDGTRNTIYKSIPGVKVILDNSSVAMTGDQPSPTSPHNIQEKKNRFDLIKVLEGEGANVREVDGYNAKDVETALKESLAEADKGKYTVLVIRGDCLQHVPPKQKVPEFQVDLEKCKKCGLCLICPGLSKDENNIPQLNHLCSNCGGNTPVCMQKCNHGSFYQIKQEDKKTAKVSSVATPSVAIDVPQKTDIDRAKLPEVLRLAIRGVGGQGSLFFGKVLTRLALESGFDKENIVKSDTHGMAQLGGPVISTFACGNTYAPFFPSQSAEVLITLEMSEILRPGFLELLKPEGTILLNTVQILPAGMKPELYPAPDKILASLSNYDVKVFDGLKLSQEIGDASGRNMNVLALGILSNIAPFDSFPLENWTRALLYVSPTDTIKEKNLLSFNQGRNFFKSLA